MTNALKQSLLNSNQLAQVNAIEQNAIELLDHTPRFKYFTLHGKAHIQNLYKILELLCNAGLKLNQEQAFLLISSICMHDLGMVVPLSDLSVTDVLLGKPQPADPATLELQVRSLHHELINQYFDRHYDFLFSIGLTAAQCALLRDISKSHRQVNIDKTYGYVRSIGALLRFIDELDIYSSRAPASVLIEHFREMDATSCWHWLKHNICDDWMLDHNVLVESVDTPKINFLIAVHPPNASSVPYWLTQIRRPIHRVLYDEGTARVISDSWKLLVSVKPSYELSTSIKLGKEWSEIQDIALSAGRKVILVVDDEVRKLEDLFLPLMMNYHIIFSQNTKDALNKIAAARIDIAIIDLQIGSGFEWSAEETQDFKMTGLKLCKEIIEKYPTVKIGILTGSRYDLKEVQDLHKIEFIIKKPVDPDYFEKEVTRVLS